MDTIVTLPDPYAGADLDSLQEIGTDTAVPGAFAPLVDVGPRSIQAAISWGRHQVDMPNRDWNRLCLAFVRQAYGLPAVYPSARSAWEHAERRHATADPADVPRGAPAFFRGGEFWHVVLPVGEGLCLSNDVRRRGRIDVVSLDQITKAWGYPLIGWTEDLNGHALPQLAPPAPRRRNVEAALAAIARALPAAKGHPLVLQHLTEARAHLAAIPRKK